VRAPLPSAPRGTERSRIQSRLLARLLLAAGHSARLRLADRPFQGRDRGFESRRGHHNVSGISHGSRGFPRV